LARLAWHETEVASSLPSLAWSEIFFAWFVLRAFAGHAERARRRVIVRAGATGSRRLRLRQGLRLLWAYEIKHDGFRFICCRAGDRVRLGAELLRLLPPCHGIGPKLVPERDHAVIADRLL
jgi:hypothetical protein